MDNALQAASRDKVTKIKALCDLLSDPELAQVARYLLAERNGHGQNHPTQSPQHHEKPSRHIRRGELVRTAKHIVLASAGPITARQVAESMQSMGFEFERRDANLAVSKALRRLAREGQLAAQRSGEGQKSALLFARPA